MVIVRALGAFFACPVPVPVPVFVFVPVPVSMCLSMTVAVPLSHWRQKRTRERLIFHIPNPWLL